MLRTIPSALSDNLRNFEQPTSSIGEDGTLRGTEDRRRPSRSLPLPSREIAVYNSEAESKLVFRLARAEASALAPVRSETIADWRRVLQLAADENAVIALRDYLRSEKWRIVPPDVQRHLAMLALDREFRMRLLEKRLEESLTALNAAGIEVMLLKGAALASTVYGSFAARPMRDIDLLVKPERADEARALISDLGWAADPELPGDESYTTHHHLPPLRDTGASGLRIEIHRALVARGHPFRFSEAEIWSAARVVSVGSARTLVMHPVHHAVHIAIHFAWSHMLKMGAWHAFRDVASLSAAGLVDWDDFVRVARRWGASSSCYWTLRLGRVLSDLPVPDSVLTSLRPHLPDLMRGPLTRHLANCFLSGVRRCPSVRLDQALWVLAMLPRGDGHGSARPWSVSKDLLFARSDRASLKGERLPSSTFQQLKCSARYLAEIIAV
jgi:putative nucleotidyltransferase-like protein